ncbi:hypothetical protein DPSP01_003251 [Paraphaeosphaeria sporulosa]|uniref:UspA domain-containing protein n=1 Tax=Paraphaeosphaeria sporulosa TaxID=1460663 RepID=A0A177CZ09_9PLEO|nr:uncharacterized protein CC84DRAFT_1080408 [Paraphaeosphaeria sporulosa]OAG12070.1 hypothetical protein CC84DRAFT_1080408 [Paraphaeosphaeria sporulosa]
MSLEAALDDERKEVLALLEANTRANSGRSGSPHVGGRAMSPGMSPVRSMLDVGGPHVADWSHLGKKKRNSSRGSNPSSPPPSARSFGGSSVDPESQYQFSMLPTIEAHSMPKRVSQGGKASNTVKPRAMSSVFGDQSGKAVSNRDRDRHGSFNGPYQSKKASSPGPGRSQSPGGRMLNTNSMNLMASPNKYVTDSGKVIDMSSAYRKLSDANLSRSGGSLSSLPNRKGSSSTKGQSLAPGGGVRLATDDFGDDEAAVESSDNDDSEDSDVDGWGGAKRRGRQRRRSDGSEGKGPKSLLAAAEEERKDVSSSRRVRSMLEPDVTITGPDGTPLAGEKMSNKKSGVHPHTNFDQGGSAVSTPYNSDTEADLSELKSAQLLSMNISPIQSSPEAHRCVRQIVRGNYGKFLRDAENGLRRQRVYLVATDISEEAAYALEWTIGTVLRDGDTLLAVYAVDEEVGVGGTDTPGGSVPMTAQQESDSLLKTLSNHQGFEAEGPGPSPLSNSVSASETDTNTMNKAEKDRYQAAVEVSDRCVKLLRKTRLQVRVVVEVFHCKSPKHMLTEVIDFLDPTLVILGSRGRNALKGVLLGSFSNYLVTKSSVPVMVARKRLRKHSKYKRKNLRLSNVISPSNNGRLVNAKID